MANSEQNAIFDDFYLEGIPKHLLHPGFTGGQGPLKQATTILNPDESVSDAGLFEKGIRYNSRPNIAELLRYYWETNTKLAGGRIRLDVDDKKEKCGVPLLASRFSGAKQLDSPFVLWKTA